MVRHHGTSIIVITKGQKPAVLRKCFRALENEIRRDGSTEALVVDWKKTEPARNLADEFGFSYCVQDGRGISNARNSGIRKAHGAHLIFVDDDVMVPRGWLKAMRMHCSEARTGCAGGRLRLEFAAKRPWWLSMEAAAQLGLFDLGEERLRLGIKSGVRNRNGNVTYPLGGNTYYRREAVERAGYFDERLMMGRMPVFGEDMDIARRIDEKGYATIYDPKAQAHHSVSVEKMGFRYVLWRYYWDGRSSVIVRGHTFKSFVRGAAARVPRALAGLAASGNPVHFFQLVHIFGEAVQTLANMLPGAPRRN